MREPERIDQTLAELGRIWKRYPDLRLGQLLVSAVHTAFGEERGMTDERLLNRLFNLEEQHLTAAMVKLERKLERLYAKQEE